ncbi:hypothetical protein BDR07DRAFT_1244590, partial [Suillus spraguei]
KTCKLQEKPAPYKQRSQTVTKNKDAPATSAKPHKVMTRKNLTLNDWLAVFPYIDTHPHQSQAKIVLHFEKEPTGALAFINSNPHALSSKRPRVVTRPDVEWALLTWVKHMEIKGDTVNGPML